MKRPANIKDKTVLQYVGYLEGRISKYEKSPFLKSYLTVLGQINDWNDQLTIKKEETTDGEKTHGRINLFADASSKEFERAHKYFTEMKPYFEQLEYLRKLMTTDEKEQVRSINPETADAFLNGNS